MKKYTFALSLVVALFSLTMLSSPAFGGGYGDHWLGAKESALGPMFTAMADDASAAYFNPAGITQLKGIQTVVGAALLIPSATVKAQGYPDSETNTSYYIPPHAYVTWQMSDRFWFGFSLNSPFGLGPDYNWDAPVRYNVTKAKVQTLNLNPNIAWKISDKLSLAAGFDVMYMKAKQENAISLAPTPFGDAAAKIEGDGYGLGWNLAAHYRPADWVSLGVSYRSGMNADIKGDINFTQPDAFRVATGSMFFNSSDVETRFKIPQQLFLGAAVKPVQTVTVGAGATWFGWSSTKDQTITFDSPVSTPLGPSTGISTQKDWKDAWRIGAGVEWNATKNVDLRLGILYDQSPIPDEHADYVIPNNDHWEFKAGVGYHQNAWSLDFAYNYLLIKDRDVQARPAEGILPSTIEASMHAFVLSFGYKF